MLRRRHVFRDVSGQASDHVKAELLTAREAVPDAFDDVASSYDLLTALNPGYRKHLRASAARLGLHGEARVLDLCCGTGISTWAIAAELPKAEIVGLDASRGMLERARAKPFSRRVRFVHGDAMNLAATGVRGPFDGVLMAYGIRNVPDIDACLANLLPILRPGGRICFHEYSVADSRRSRLVWRLVTTLVVVPGGIATSGSGRLYRYLRRSVLDFDGVRGFEDRLRSAGFVAVRTQAMTGWQRGIVHSFLAERPNT